MHSALMRDYSPNISSAPLNAIIAIQRRYQNLYLDQARQSQYEMLLGMNLDKHLPSLLGNSVECLSRYPSFSLKNVPCVLSNVKTPELLLQDADNFCWICPSGYDIVELYIYLHQPAYVTELSLTICHGSSDETSPRIIDMFMGSYLDKMNVVFQGLTIPRAASGSQLYYSIPSSIWKAYEGSGIYDFEIGSDQSKEVTQTRIVHIVFRGTPTDYNMSLGKLELFGVISRAEYPLRALHRLQDQLTLLTVYLLFISLHFTDSSILSRWRRSSKKSMLQLKPLPPPTTPLTTLTTLTLVLVTVVTVPQVVVRVLLQHQTTTTRSLNT